VKRTLENLLEAKASVEAEIVRLKKGDEAHPDEQLYEMFHREPLEESLRLIDERIASYG
jgi:hypothetical protein